MVSEVVARDEDKSAPESDLLINQLKSEIKAKEDETTERMEVDEVKGTSILNLKDERQVEPTPPENQSDQNRDAQDEEMKDVEEKKDLETETEPDKQR